MPDGKALPPWATKLAPAGNTRSGVVIRLAELHVGGLQSGVRKSRAKAGSVHDKSPVKRSLRTRPAGSRAPPIPTPVPGCRAECSRPAGGACCNPIDLAVDAVVPQVYRAWRSGCRGPDRRIESGLEIGPDRPPLAIGSPQFDKGRDFHLPDLLPCCSQVSRVLNDPALRPVECAVDIAGGLGDDVDGAGKGVGTVNGRNPGHG